LASVNAEVTRNIDETMRKARIQPSTGRFQMPRAIAEMATPKEIAACA
jgi:hypothetical protein